ncbi:hypothetical protein SBA5_1070023 [Candidatus Sulfotelmatomonas gaucii]|uniref:Uncharacterized protein n=1 Tax=Candidatus Sulfuritelmatomonas gaucii TaxID=2043161 RepID=A0A2N9L2Z1_9BACT|nr:hypothetical protein SBA5_1070023 [Candidatus Sulfotelmatomonas gaucii]
MAASIDLLDQLQHFQTSAHVSLLTAYCVADVSLSQTVDERNSVEQLQEGRGEVSTAFRLSDPPRSRRTFCTPVEIRHRESRDHSARVG